MSRRQRVQIDREQLRITRGAAILLFVEVGFTLVFHLVDKDVQARWAPWVVPSASTVWEHLRFWTVITGPFLEPDLLSLLLQGLMLWLFVPALERWWGTPRFLRFAAYTAIPAALVGTFFGEWVFGRDVPMLGLDAFIWASVVAFGIIYARQPVQFFGVMPITGRQLMYGTLAFVTLFVVLQGAWEQGAGYATAIGLAVVLTNQRWNPRLAWLRWKKTRERAHLSVLVGGKAGAAKGAKAKKKPDQWLN